jgi:hypothetical protein
MFYSRDLNIRGSGNLINYFKLITSSKPINVFYLIILLSLIFCCRRLIIIFFNIIIVFFLSQSFLETLNYCGSIV